MKRNILFIILLAIITIYPLSIVFQNYNTYFSKGYHEKYESLKKVYYSSQYADKNHTGFITDETLESFAGGIFLTGINPILIHHDQPPLGRYIIALSIILFDNENTIPLLLLFISGLGLYLVSLIAVKNKFIALIPVGIFINQPMFINKLAHIPLLEPIQLPFIIFALYFFIIGIQKKNYIPWFVITALLIGCIISIRFFVLGVFLVCALLTFLLMKKKFKMLMTMIITLVLSLTILLISYFQTFKDGYSLLKVLGIQKYIFVYRQSALTEPFSFWDLLLFNKWHTWWGDHSISSDPEWSLLWPISVAIILIYLCFVLFKKIKLSSIELILILWLGFYSIMLSVGYTSTRYFLPIIPFLYILATSFTAKLLLSKKTLPKKLKK